MTGKPETNRFAPHLVDDRQYRLLVESVTDYAIYMLDPNGVVASWNAGAERFKGYTSVDVIGRNFSMFYMLEDQARGEPGKALNKASRDGRFESEGWRIRKDGSRFWASVVIDPVFDGKNLLGFAKITRDISERKEAEQALIHVNAALLQSQKMEAVGQLTGGIAHDFNNLLAAVLGSLELLRRRLPRDPKSVKLLENAVQGARRGTALTQRMLAFARRQDLTPELVDLTALVRGMTTFMLPALGPAVSIQTNLPLKPHVALVDANQVEMALLNLAVNARDAMPSGGAIIIEIGEETLATGEVHGLGAGLYACLSVRDSGVGMDATTLARAMEPFYTTKEPGQGTGLGLAMVHGTAIQAGGRLVLESEVGRGTVAKLWLPLTDTHRDAGDTPAFAAGGATATPARVVLAVDDDPLVLLNTVMMLEDLGHTVFEADCGRRALELLAQEPAIDIVVTDMAMPRMTGLQLFWMAQKLYPALRFVLATGYAESTDDDAPALPRLAKPFGQEDLAKAIQLSLGADLATPRIVQFPLRPRRRD